MSFREESGGEDGGWSSSASDMRKSFLHTGSCYKMSAAAGMGSRQSSLMERLGSSAYSLRDGSVSAVLCTLIVALGPIQFGFTCGYSSPTQDAIISHLGIAPFCSWVGCWKDLESVNPFCSWVGCWKDLESV